MKKFILVALLMASNVYSQSYTPNNSGDISLKCSKTASGTVTKWKKSETTWGELLWVINVDANYVVEMLDIQMDNGSYKKLSDDYAELIESNKFAMAIKVKREEIYPIVNKTIKGIHWREYIHKDMYYYLDRETLLLDVIRDHVVETADDYSCEIITRQELDEIKLKRLQAKSVSLKAALDADQAALEANRIKKEKEDAEQRKKNKL
jgi:hypothetical protein